MLVDKFHGNYHGKTRRAIGSVFYTSTIVYCVNINPLPFSVKNHTIYNIVLGPPCPGEVYARAYKRLYIDYQ